MILTLSGGNTAFLNNELPDLASKMQEGQGCFTPTFKCPVCC